MTRLTSFNFPSLSRAQNLPELSKTTYNFGENATPAFTIPDIDSDFDVYEFTLEVDTTLTLTNFDDSITRIRYFANTSFSTHDLIVTGVFTLNPGEVAAVLYNNDTATLLWKTTAGTSGSLEPELLNDSNDGDEIDPGVYVIDTSTAAFSITLPSEQGVWEFHTPYASIEDNVLTIDAGDDQSFSDESGTLQQDDFELNTQLSLVTVVNTDGSDNFYVTVTDSKYESVASGFIIGATTTASTATAVKGRVLLVDTRTTTVTVNPPADPETNDIFGVTDAYSNATANNITIDFMTAGHLIHSQSENIVLNVNTARMKFLYANDTIGWILT